MRLGRLARRAVNWLLGVPPPDDLHAHRELRTERDRQRDGAVEAADRGNVTGMRPGGGPQDGAGW
jgi:hypothetical protein